MRLPNHTAKRENETPDCRAYMAEDGKDRHIMHTQMPIAHPCHIRFEALDRMTKGGRLVYELSQILIRVSSELSHVEVTQGMPLALCRNSADVFTLCREGVFLL